MFFLAKIVRLDMLSEVHALFEFGGVATRISDSILVLLSHFAHVVDFIDARQVLLMKQFAQQIRFGVLQILQLLAQARLLELLQVSNQLH